jgi:hypothetical protein
VKGLSKKTATPWLCQECAEMATAGTQGKASSGLNSLSCHEKAFWGGGDNSTILNHSTKWR